MLPDAPRMLDLERRCRREGSGLQPDDLIGSWRLERVWSKGSLRPAALSASLLRGLAARLQMEADASGPGLRLVNSVRLGALGLRFEGTGRLQGRRPLLEFQFDRWLLSLAGRVLIERALPAPAPRQRPFFALIAARRPASGTAGEPVGWLAARGRGGGLALWCLEADPEGWSRRLIQTAEAGAERDADKIRE
ncbi:MAG: hypothetical protein ER33_10115 [Cyanobium sp. CACIAM 14]|nr:MAG: hypothetical protein ER33_10115 [Cyanobium sp. CACIAM 14]